MVIGEELAQRDEEYLEMLERTKHPRASAGKFCWKWDNKTTYEKSRDIEIWGAVENIISNAVVSRAFDSEQARVIAEKYVATTISERNLRHGYRRLWDENEAFKKSDKTLRDELKELRKFKHSKTKTQDAEAEDTNAAVLRKQLDNALTEIQTLKSVATPTTNVIDGTGMLTKLTHARTNHDNEALTFLSLLLRPIRHELAVALQSATTAQHLVTSLTQQNSYIHEEALNMVSAAVQRLGGHKATVNATVSRSVQARLSYTVNQADAAIVGMTDASTLERAAMTAAQNNPHVIDLTSATLTPLPPWSLSSRTRPRPQLDNPVNSKEDEEKDERDKLDDAVTDKVEKILVTSPSSSSEEEDSIDEDNAVNKNHKLIGNATGPRRTPESQENNTHDPTLAGTPAPALNPALTLAAAKKRRAEMQLSDAVKRRK
jgi:hypothetical protein